MKKLIALVQFQIMGSDRKSQKNNRKRSSYSASEEEDEGRSKRQKRRVEDEERKHRSGKKDKESSHKHSKRCLARKEKKSKEKQKDKHCKGDGHSVIFLSKLCLYSSFLSPLEWLTSSFPINASTFGQVKRMLGNRTNYNFHELSNDDYFSKNNEFATWLKEEKDVFFSDLSSESAREMFSDFVKAWNNQTLESQYYEGIVSGPRSAHKWKFKA
ncbi:style cell-cycle inhibitor 1-A-like [Ziziphus jujuba]|uniref:Style cell-cycle inhibitor 1-A-like n=1 Tax=Ziziphus jujuba TaxID=326968 RepID=A0ABM4A2A9_ZIZJJ|nr:style cell-cycle inhibitor 1-A-like [Ziziphus jujuba]